MRGEKDPAAMARLEIQNDPAGEAFVGRPMSRTVNYGGSLHGGSVHEIALRQRQYCCRFASEKPTVRVHFIRLWVDLDAWQSVIQYHRMLVDLARVAHGEYSL